MPQYRALTERMQCCSRARLQLTCKLVGFRTLPLWQRSRLLWAPLGMCSGDRDDDDDAANVNQVADREKIASHHLVCFNRKLNA